MIRLKKIQSYWYQSAFFTIIQRFSIVLFGLISYLILVRVLTEEEMGIWALFLAIGTTFELTKTSLLKNALITILNGTVVETQRIQISSTALLINILYTVLFDILIITFSGFLSNYWKIPLLHTMLIWYILISLFLIPFSHFEYVQQANMKFNGTFAAYFVRQGLFFAIVSIALIFSPKSITLVRLVIAQAFAVFWGGVVSYFFTKKFLHQAFNPCRYWFSRLINYGKYVFGSGVCSNIFGSLDRYMTASFLSSIVVAFYDVAARINNIINIPTNAAADVIFPKSARASTDEGKEKVRYMYEKMSGILTGLILPVSIFVIIFAEWVIRIIAGEKYLAAAGIVRIAMLYATLFPIQTQAANILNSINKPKVTFYINMSILSVNLVLNYIFIHSFGFMGAAYGTLFTTIFGFSVTFYFLHKMLGARLSAIFSYAIQFYKNSFIKITSYKTRSYTAISEKN